ncbi:hypothetical protein TIFTF001_021083 [Ficus carica]|uniref:Uncharacterized protein n=1 Tax=Ficus carica TaxID=3494 RepID=A0AA88AS82_FICCA|nr:hypothetical protein TIFTF001_021083 [Ficus carica]
MQQPRGEDGMGSWKQMGPAGTRGVKWLAKKTSVRKKQWMHAHGNQQDAVSPTALPSVDGPCLGVFRTRNLALPDLILRPCKRF